jgi:acetyl-CoA acyltransferase
VKAIAAGGFQDEILQGYEVSPSSPDLSHRARTVTVRIVEKLADTDEGPRPDYDDRERRQIEARLRRASGSVTAGNSSQMSDGAGAVVLMSEAGDEAERRAARALLRASRWPACRPRSWASARSRPSRRSLKQAGVTTLDLDWIELNEAFAAQAWR